ncbi:hypothetical protein [Serratia sp. M24T3]|uniref:hypothetical protein n=1 Tax=Serratia sp. M24T3 TaxID=932213 RepID=UPI0012F50BE9|nr:hypothetical protein [Serratia sp. M24T3]
MYPVGLTGGISLTQITPAATENKESCKFTNNLKTIINALIQPATVHATSSTPLPSREKVCFSYMDPFGLNKKYVAGETRSIKAKDSPFESDLISHLIDNKNPEKSRLTETSSAVEVPMTGDDGRNYLVRSNFVHYRGPQGQVTIMPDGEVDLSESQHMKRNMLPGMARKSGEFVVYEIPVDEMTQTKSGTFSSFTLFKD